MSFQTKIMQRLSVGGPAECWEWKGAKQSAGYGAVRNPEGKYVLVHRAAYELWRGPIPDGLTIDHLCRNRLCANPKHMEPVTQRENVLRGESHAARNARKTHCKWGHEFSPENTLINKGARYCRACLRRRSREWLARQK